MKDLRTVRRHVLGGVILFLLVGVLPAQADSPGSATATFLKLDPYARSAAQGSAFLGKSGIPSLQFNKAGLGFTETTDVSITQNDIFAGITYWNASLVQTTPENRGAFGFSFTSLDFGKQDRTKINNNDPITGLGQFSASDISLNVSYGRRLHKTLSVGAGLKYIESDIAGFQGGTLSGDLGIQYRIPTTSWRFGVSGRNLFGSVELNERSDPLPRVYEVGGNYRYTLVEDRHEFDLGFGTGNSNDSDGYFFGGIDYRLFNVGSLRLGFHGAQDADDGFTFGAGLNYRGIRVDFAYVPFGDLGRQQRFSFGYRFGGVTQSASNKDKTSPENQKTNRDETSSDESQNVADRLDRARGLYRDGSFEKSLELLRTLHQEAPNNVDVLLWLGVLEYKMGDRPSAIDRMGRVLEIDPDNQYAQRNLEKLRSD